VFPRKCIRDRRHLSGVISSDGTSAVLTLANNDLDSFVRLNCDEQIGLTRLNLRAYGFQTQICHEQRARVCGSQIRRQLLKCQGNGDAALLVVVFTEEPRSSVHPIPIFELAFDVESAPSCFRTPARQSYNWNPPARIKKVQSSGRFAKYCDALSSSRLLYSGISRQRSRILTQQVIRRKEVIPL
jgi:hypothetical protein